MHSSYQTYEEGYYYYLHFTDGDPEAQRDVSVTKASGRVES